MIPRFSHRMGYIAHRMQNLIRIEAERKFADETRTGIGIENLVQLLRHDCWSLR